MSGNVESFSKAGKKITGNNNNSAIMTNGVKKSKGSSK